VGLLLSLAFLGYGIVIVVLVRRHAPGELQQSVKTIAVAVAIVLAYACPVAVYMVRPLGGCVSSGILRVFGYIVPCALVSTVVLFLIVEYVRREVLAKERVQHLASEAPLLETPAQYDNI
jgi:hypothetical protein